MASEQFLENLWLLTLALLRYNVTLTVSAVLLAFPIASLLAPRSAVLLPSDCVPRCGIYQRVA